jgi:hypothetical protein
VPSEDDRCTDDDKAEAHRFRQEDRGFHGFALAADRRFYLDLPAAYSPGRL